MFYTQHFFFSLLDSFHVVHANFIHCQSNLRVTFQLEFTSTRDDFTFLWITTPHHTTLEITLRVGGTSRSIPEVTAMETAHDFDGRVPMNPINILLSFTRVLTAGLGIISSVRICWTTSLSSFSMLFTLVFRGNTLGTNRRR
jgi:hypothetical protein